MKKGVLLVVLVIALVFTGAIPVLASSHREAPLIANDPVADNTDVYMFRSPDKPDTVTIIANYIPLEEPAGGPNFYKFGDDVLYEMHLFNSRNQQEGITYQFRFKTKVLNGDTFLYNTGPISSITDPHFNVQQTYSVTRIGSGKAQVLGTDIPTPPCNVGPHSIPNYAALRTQAITTLKDGSKVFAGQRADPFFVDLGAVFDLLTIRGGIPAGFSSGGVNGLSGFNVHSIALQVPIKDLTANGSVPTNPLDPNAVIGVYASASRQRVTVLRSGSQAKPQSSGEFVQVSRLAEPLINEALIPLKSKDEWNASNPVNDRQFIGFYQDPELARLLHVLHGINTPPTPRNDLVAILLNGFTLGNFSTLGGPPNADLIRLNVAIAPTSTPNRLGLLGGDPAGFPNGRRLTDDVVDIELRAIAGATPFTPSFNVFPNNALGDGVNQSDVPFLEHFPYMADPYSGFSHVHQPS